MVGFVAASGESVISRQKYLQFFIDCNGGCKIDKSRKFKQTVEYLKDF